MRDICHIKKISHDYNSFWFASLLTMIFYSSYSRKIIYYSKLFNNNDDFNNDKEPLFIYLKEIFNKNNDYVDIFSPNIFNEIINLNFYNLDENVIEYINKNGYLKSFFIHHFFNYLNISHLIIDYDKKDFYLGYAENINLIVKSNNDIYIHKLPYKLDDYVNYMRKKINNNIPQYIIVNIYNDTIISNGIDNLNEEHKKKLNLNYYNIDIEGLNTFEKFIILNNNKYILDSVSFDYKYDDSIIGIHCNNKKFIYDEKSKLFNKEWTFYNLNKKPKMTMLVYVLYETKKINNIICYSSVNNNLFANHWFNCFLTMIFQSSYSKKILFSLKPFNNYSDELSLFFNNILKNNKIIKNYKINNIINLFNFIKTKNKLFKYINTYGYPIHNFLPIFFDKFDIDFLMLDYYKKNFYIGFNENYYYYLDANNVTHTKFKFPENNDIDEFSNRLDENIINNEDYIPNYIIINILNETKNYIDDFNDEYKEKLNFDYYNTNINGLKSFKDIIIFKGRKYKLDSISLNNSTNKINTNNNSIIGINCNDNKYIYNGSISSNKDPKRKLPCKLINHNWNIKNKSYFYIDTDKCSINKTTKTNKTTNNFSFNNGFRILIYVLLIDDYKYESDKFDYKSSNIYKSEISSSSSSSSKSLSHKKDIALSPIIFNDKDNKNDKIKSSIKSKSKSLSHKKDIALSPIIFNDNNDNNDNDDNDDNDDKNDKIKCPKNKIYNPKTKRCVSKTGKIGKELLNLK